MDKVTLIQTGDEITFTYRGKLAKGIVEGFIDRVIDGRCRKCVTLENSKLWVPVSQVVSRTRQGATVTFER